MENKTMVQKSDEVAPMIPVARDIKGGREVEMDGYHTVAGTTTQNYVTYMNRRDQLAEALGCKSTVTG